MSLITLNNISKYYDKNDRKVLTDINLAIEKGDMIAIMGPSGSGKSTLLNIIGCLDNYSVGDYRLDGINVNHKNINLLNDIRNKKISFVFQNFALVKDFTVASNVCMPLNFRKIKKSEKIKLVEKYLKYVEMIEYINTKVNKLSGGQQQRIAIARALVQESDIILADEPTGALDKKNGQLIMGIFKSLNESHNKTIIIVTHDENVAKQCKKIIYLEDGYIIRVLNNNSYRKAK